MIEPGLNVRHCGEASDERRERTSKRVGRDGHQAANNQHTKALDGSATVPGYNGSPVVTYDKAVKALSSLGRVPVSWLSLSASCLRNHHNPRYQI